MFSDIVLGFHIDLCLCILYKQKPSIYLAKVELLFAKSRPCGGFWEMKPGKEGQDSLNNIIRQAIDKETLLSVCRTGDNPVHWNHLLQCSRPVGKQQFF